MKLGIWNSLGSMITYLFKTVTTLKMRISSHAICSNIYFIADNSDESMIDIKSYDHTIILSYDNGETVCNWHLMNLKTE